MQELAQQAAIPLFMFIFGLVIGGGLTALVLHKWRKTNEAGYQAAAAKAKEAGDRL